MKCPMCGAPPGMGAFEVHPPGQHLGRVIVCPKCDLHNRTSIRLINYLTNIRLLKETPNGIA